MSRGALPSRQTIEAAQAVFRTNHGVLRTSDAIRHGVHPRTLYMMRDTGQLEQLGRGLYRLAGLSELGNPDLVTVGLKLPSRVVCLISALAFHGLTTQIPHQVYLAVKRGSEPPRLNYPPIRVFWFGGEAFSAGIETHMVDGTSIQVYSPEKTLADCFKYRNKIGLDVAKEALKLYRKSRPLRVSELLRFAAICRVEKVMSPYIEALL